MARDSKTTGHKDDREWMREGREMSAAEAVAIEESLCETTEDFAAHVRLGSYYAFKVYSDDIAAAKLLEHAGWIIKNHPESDAVRSLMPFMQGRGSKSAETMVRLWEEQVSAYPDDPKVLGNAAQALANVQQERAVALLAQCEELEPENADWPAQRGHALGLGLYPGRDDGDPRSRAALEAYERWLALVGTPRGDFTRLGDIGHMALLCGEDEKARAAGVQLLEMAAAGEVAHFGNSIHDGHTLLGRVLLREGNLTGAGEQLLASARHSGSPQLNSFGPNMTLAKELLERGERGVVLEYFRLCGAFWNEPTLEEWTRQVESGEAPQFGANLVY